MSMVFEISWLMGPAGKPAGGATMNTVTVRSARAARIGARAGRLSRPLRLMGKLLKGEEIGHDEAGYSAKVLGKKLTQVFSSKVALLTVVLVLGVPVFNIGRFPEDDFSLQSWLDKLEMDYGRNVNDILDGRVKAHSFTDSVSDMGIFYEKGCKYFPYQMDGYPTHFVSDGKKVSMPSFSVLQTAPPTRAQNIMEMKTDFCSVDRPGCTGDEKAQVLFNFTVPNQKDASLDMAVTIFIIVCMLVESCDLSYSVDRMMVKPMERMLDSAKLMTKQLNQVMSRGKPGKLEQQAKEMAKDLKDVQQDPDSDDEDDEENEIEKLQQMFKKVVFLVTVFMEQDVAEATEGGEDDVATQAVMCDIAENKDAIAVHEQAAEAPAAKDDGRGTVASVASVAMTAVVTENTGGATRGSVVVE